MTKPREWWLNTVTNGVEEDAIICSGSVIPSEYLNQIHVIEKSAYDELESKYNTLKMEFDCRGITIDKLIKIMESK